MAKKFEDLTIKGQKMRIVRDAIAQIEIKKFIPRRGDYLSVDDWEYLKEIDSLQTYLKSDKKCECCAKGGLFAACVIETNEVYSDDPYDDEEFQKEKLIKWFSTEELDTIETAFECRVIVDDENVLLKEYSYGFDNAYSHRQNYLNNKDRLTKLGQKAIKFGLKYKNETNRLLAILNNILKNGEFKP